MGGGSGPSGNFPCADNTGYASLTVEGKSALYEISLLTGSADPVGWFWKRHHITGIAIPPNQH